MGESRLATETEIWSPKKKRRPRNQKKAQPIHINSKNLVDHDLLGTNSAKGSHRQEATQN